MERRKFIQNGGLATLGTLAASSIYGFTLGNKSVDESIKKVLLIFKTHLDIGFTNLAGNVIKTYMEEFIPGALTLAEKLRQQTQNDRYIWTTGSWLITQFLEKSTPEMRKRMENAIDAGDIVWHGLPFTTHSELADPSLFELGIQLSAGLDKRFGKNTIAAKMTDVPGHTQSLVPILAKNNLGFLHIGDNPASMPPDVPPLFVWRAPDDSEIVVMYQKDYGSQMIIPGTQTAVAICFTSDNHGPHTPEQIAKIYSDIRQQFPNATVEASTLNDLALEVSSVRNQLPVVTQEIGDTWIHGVGSDPLKIARFREVSRLRTKWLQENKLSFGSKNDLDFGIPLLMVAEHTWGLDVKTFLADWDIYTPEAFNAARNRPNFKLMEQSWNEKRQYINDAVATLTADKAAEVTEKLQNLKVVPTNQTGYSRIADFEKPISTKFFELKLNPENGGIIRFTDKDSGFNWATENSPLCLYSYQTFSQGDYKRYQDQYLTQKSSWALGDFGKTGQEIAHAESRVWLPSLTNAYIKTDITGLSILLELVIHDEKANPVGGSPEKITVDLYFPNEKKELQATLQWFNKTAYRLPEASWFSFVPAIQEGNWILDKIGSPVNFRDVVKNGNRKLHAIIDDVKFENSHVKCAIQSLDAPLVAPGDKNFMNFDNQQPEANEGVHFCLHNNVWGTNFMMWFDDDMKYRFVFKA